MPTLLQGEACQTHSLRGAVTIYKKKLPDLTTFGITDLTDITVLGDTHFHGISTVVKGTFRDITASGPLTLTLTKAEKLTVHGPLEADRCAFSDNLAINGPVNMKSTTAKDVTVHYNKITLENTIIDTLVIKWDPEKNLGTPPEVFLKGNTQVKTIIFEGTEGIIRKSEASQCPDVRNSVVKRL